MSLTQQQFENLKIGGTVYIIITEDWRTLDVVSAEITGLTSSSVTYRYENSRNHVITETLNHYNSLYIDELSAYKEMTYHHKREIVNQSYDLQINGKIIDALVQKLGITYSDLETLVDGLLIL